jgi:hypothetical protein
MYELEELILMMNVNRRNVNSTVLDIMENRGEKAQTCGRDA